MLGGLGHLCRRCNKGVSYRLPRQNAYGQQLMRHDNPTTMAGNY